MGPFQGTGIWRMACAALLIVSGHCPLPAAEYLQTDGITGVSNEVSSAVYLGDDNELWDLSHYPDDLA